MNQALTDALINMKKLDDDAHAKLTSSSENFDANEAAYKQVHRENAERLDKIIDKFGWPTVEEVGLEASYAAFHVANHANEIPTLQRKFLGSLSGAGARAEAPQKHVAFLVDRVRFNQGQKQMYGTVLDWVEGGTLGCDLEDKERANEFRQLVGFPPLEEAIAAQTKEMLRLGAKPPQGDALKAYRQQHIDWAKSVGWIE